MEKILETIPGWSWDVIDDSWEEGFKHFKEFKETNGHLNFITTYVNKKCFKLGQWVNVQRSSKNKMAKVRPVST